jgi:hypothetical protein
MPRRTTEIAEPPNPSGLCMCGCGQPTPIAPRNRRAIGHVAGWSIRYISGHNRPRRLKVEYVEDSVTGCWVWQGSLASNGYGVTQTNGILRRAHRVYYERLVGPIPEGRELDHLCRNRACVRPSHLEPVTCAENVRRGLKTKLTHANIATIRRRLSAGWTQQQIADQYGVHSSQISRINTGATWRDDEFSSPIY